MIVTVFLSIFSLVVVEIHADTLSRAFNLSPNLQNYVVKLHNKARSQVAKGMLTNQPAGTNMQTMKWDSNLAAFAQKWVNQCRRLEHSSESSRNNITGYWYVGENLALGSPSALSSNADLRAKFKKSVDMWMEEYLQFKYPNTCSGSCGHYTQVVWATSNNLGCAIAECRSTNGVTLSWLVACEYGPGGNVQQYDANHQLYMPPPYTSGTTCSACPQESSACNTTGLCG